MIAKKMGYETCFAVSGQTYPRKLDSQILNLLSQIAQSAYNCYDLRPNGFTDNDPPHACESLTVDAIFFTYEFISAI